MSKDTETLIEEEPKGGKIKKILLVFTTILLLLGIGGTGGFFASGILNQQTDVAPDPNKPKLVFKDGSDPLETPAIDSEERVKAQIDHSSLKATYYPIEVPFTSNLKNSNSFAQLSLAVSTYYDERVVENIQDHETAIRSSILMTIAEQDSEGLSTQEGKKVLQGLLATSINDVLKEKSGFGGVDNVYFTSFVVQ